MILGLPEVRSWHDIKMEGNLNDYIRILFNGSLRLLVWTMISPSKEKYCEALNYFMNEWFCVSGFFSFWNYKK